MSNLVELARRLHQERLFVKHEQDTIWKLNKQVQTHAEQVSHSFWVTRQHYLNLSTFIRNSAQGSSVECCRRSRLLDSVQFVDGCKELGYQEESMYSQFIEAFFNNPTLAAACLAYGDKLGLEATPDVAHSIVLGCYGNNIMTDDHKHILELMETLMLLQLACEDQPRRLIHKQKCAFSVILKLFMESLPLGKLFLAFALHKPVMEVLMDDELLLETNKQKLLTQLTVSEVERRFGNQNSPEFQEKLNHHVKNAEKQISKICSCFISGMFSAMSCFPQSLGWIIAKSYQVVKDAGKVSSDEARALCADIFLQQFVCPAIVNPELFGVTGDVPVSNISRQNLMQIAQVLQMMAHLDENSQKNDSTYSWLKTDTMQSLIDAVINTCSSDTVPNTHKSPLGYANSAVFFTPHQLAQMIKFLRDIKQSEVRGVDQSSLDAILSHLPSQPSRCIERALNSLTLPSPEENGLQRSSTVRAGDLTPSGGSAGDLMDLLQPSLAAVGRKTLTRNGKSKRIIKRDDTNDSTMDDSASGDLGTSKLNQSDPSSEMVLVITLHSLAGTSQEMLGTMTENEVLELQSTQNMTNSAVNLTVENASLDARSLTETEGLEKRSRFSLYSGGSDLSEVDEELPTEDGISRTSGSSSLDPTEEVPPDDTSSFHAVSIPAENQDEDEEEEGIDQGSVSRANNDEALKALRSKLPTSRGESIQDKMRKFEIRQELGVRFADPGVPGEPRTSGQQGSAAPVDTRSETWSIDAYASDSEPQTEQESQSERLQEFAEDNPQPPRSASNPAALLMLQRDEDSRSDVWSVEVLPSDSEPPDVQSEDRLRELDADAAAAQSEDALEENRSRASTPGLSAASGFSGVSALSAVSEINQRKATVEAWVGVEKNFAIAPSSVSPDAEDLLIKTEGSSSGGHSVESDHNASSSMKMNEASSKNQQSPPQIAKAAKDSADRQKKAEAIESSRAADLVFPIPKLSATGKSVAWNVTDTSNTSKPSQTSSQSTSMDFDENVNTIKRSPYKRQNHDDKRANCGAESQVPPVLAWDEKPGVAAEEVANVAAKASLSNQKEEGSVLMDFDPLMSGETKHEEVVTNESKESVNEKNRPAANGGLGIILNKNTGVLKQHSFGKGDQDVNKAVTASDFADGTGLPRRGFDRKKPWWKNITSKRRATKLINFTPVDGQSSPNESPKHRRSTDASPSPSSELQTSVIKTPIEEMTSPVEDIMQKYMEKASKSTRSGAGTPEIENSPAKKPPEPRNSSDLTGSVQDVSNSASGTPLISFDDKPTYSADVPAPFVSGWNSDFGTPPEPTPDVEVKSVEIAVKSDADIKEEAKRKLRTVFAASEPLPEAPSIDLLLLGVSSSAANLLYASQSSSQTSGKLKLRDHLLSFLRSQYAEALTLLNYSRVTQIDEVIRCVEALDDQNCKHVIKSLWRDYKQRSSYVAYLVRSRQHLLASLSYLRHVGECTERDKVINRRYFTAQCVKSFLQQHDEQLRHFRTRFIHSETYDEKAKLLRRFLGALYTNMLKNSIWEGASQEQLDEAEKCIERCIFSTVYKPAMFPNADGDMLRDQLFRDHISRLSVVVTPSHPALQVNSKYLLECPWPAAQREVKALSAFRSPRGKLQAALRCCSTVMHLLKLADESSVPAADDFTPVLVFVLIKANPPHLLSTLQYVDNFMGDQLSGEDAYWWMQFSAATLFIKTIDERK